MSAFNSKKHTCTMTLFTGCTFLLFSVFGSAQDASETDASATVFSVIGQVNYQGAGETAWTPASKGQALLESTRLSTGEGSSTVIEFKPGHRARLDENTEILLKELSYTGRRETERTSIDLAVGKILSRVRKLRTKDSEYSVRTPTAAAAVRGTVFEVAYDDVSKKTTIRVLEGLVELESRLGRRLRTTLREREKAGVDSLGELGATQKLPDREADQLESSSQQVPSTKGAAAEGGAIEKMESIQSNAVDRLEAIQERLSDENRAIQIQRLLDDDDDD